MRYRRFFTIAILIILFTTVLNNASADMAPPLQPSGGNMGTLEYIETDVVMVYEDVVIAVGETGDLYYAENLPNTVNTHVTARFQMVNRGEQEESLKPIFPLSNPSGYGDGYFNVPEIQNLVIKVNDVATPWETATSPNPLREEGEPVRWAEFAVDFPAKASTWVEVEYDVQSTGYHPEATFYYILETGSGWSGPIEEGHIQLLLPYDASEENVLFGHHYMHPFRQKTSAGGVFSGKVVTWDFYFLEPTEENNWSATIINPLVWEEYLALQERVDSGDESAYAELTAVYDTILIGRDIRRGTEGMIDPAYKAYLSAIELEPENDDVLARFAEFQLFLLERDGVSFYGPESALEPYLNAVRALAINPSNETANSVKLWIEISYDLSAEKGSLPTETAPPVAEDKSSGSAPEETPTEAQIAVREQDTSEDADAAKPAWILLSALTVLSLALGMIIYVFVRRRDGLS